jgi:Flp pilus assembly protein CpaB
VITPRLPRRRGRAGWEDQEPAAEQRVRLAPRAGRTPGARRVRLRAALRPLPLVGCALLVGGATLAQPWRAPAAGPTAVLVAARTLPAGTLLASGDLARARIGAGGALLASLVPAGQEPQLLGDTLGEPLTAGEPLLRSALAAGRDPAAFTLTVGEEHALGGALRTGDRVSVLATFATASGGAFTRLVARGLIVLSVGSPPSFGDPSEQTVPVTVELPDPALAAELALANSVAHIDLLRDGAATPAAIHAVSEAA